MHTQIGDTATVEVDGERITGTVYHVRENGWPCVQTTSGRIRIASGPATCPICHTVNDRSLSCPTRWYR